MPHPAHDDPLRSALFTDLYELTMAQSYAATGMEEQAVFELFIREMPPERNYFVAAGLDDVLTYLENVHFTDDDLAYLVSRLRRAWPDVVLHFRGDSGFGVPAGRIWVGIVGCASACVVPSRQPKPQAKPFHKPLRGSPSWG